jgi:peptide chain release factor 1
MNSIIVEIRGAEGGDHSKLLVKDMATVYRKICEKNSLELSVIEDRSGFMSLLIEGHKSTRLFADEAGGHRFQTVSPTDKRGRVHTSTITVYVMDNDDKNYYLDMKDVEYTLTRGSGPGGMNRNKVESCVVAIHKPTKISVRIDARDQHKNKALATKILSQRVAEYYQNNDLAKEAKARKDTLGSGMRGDKRRTYREKDNQIIDHETGKTWQYKKWMKGQW